MATEVGLPGRSWHGSGSSPGPPLPAGVPGLASPSRPPAPLAPAQCGLMWHESSSSPPCIASPPAPTPAPASFTGDVWGGPQVHGRGPQTPGRGPQNPLRLCVCVWKGTPEPPIQPGPNPPPFPAFAVRPARTVRDPSALWRSVPRPKCAMQQAHAPTVAPRASRWLPTHTARPAAPPIAV